MTRMPLMSSIHSPMPPHALAALAYSMLHECRGDSGDDDGQDPGDAHEEARREGRTGSRARGRTALAVACHPRLAVFKEYPTVAPTSWSHRKFSRALTGAPARSSQDVVGEPLQTETLQTETLDRLPRQSYGVAGQRSGFEAHLR